MLDGQSFLDQWQRALDSGKEVIVMGDFNLNHLKFTDAGQLQPLVDQLIQDIYPHGVQQCVKGPTHSLTSSTPTHQERLAKLRHR